MDKKTQKLLDTISSNYEQLLDARQTVIDALQQTCAAIDWTPVMIALENAEEIRDVLFTQVDELWDTMNNYVQGRSEKWQESEKGHAYQQWVEALEGCREDIDSSVESEHKIEIAIETGPMGISVDLSCGLEVSDIYVDFEIPESPE